MSERRASAKVALSSISMRIIANLFMYPSLEALGLLSSIRPVLSHKMPTFLDHVKNDRLRLTLGGLTNPLRNTVTCLSISRKGWNYTESLTASSEMID